MVDVAAAGRTRTARRSTAPAATLILRGRVTLVAFVFLVTTFTAKARENAPLVARTTAVPVCLAVTVPGGETVATPGAPLVHVTAPRGVAPGAGTATAKGASLPPTATGALLCETVGAVSDRSAVGSTCSTRSESTPGTAIPSP